MAISGEVGEHVFVFMKKALQDASRRAFLWHPEWFSSGAKQGDYGKAAIRVTATIICHYKRLRRMAVRFGEEEGPLLKKGIFLPQKGSPK